MNKEINDAIPQLNAIDFFCGAGGLTRGFLDAGINVVMGIDANEECRKTYEANNLPAKFLHADICKLTTGSLRCLEDIPPDQLLLAGCAPCQPFTKQRRETKGSTQNTLLGHFARFIADVRPGQIFIENVPGLTKVQGNSTYLKFIKLLSQLDYHIASGVVDAKWYGVPQTRRRFILLAARTFRPTLPPITHGPGLIPYVTVKDAIGSYPIIKAGETHRTIPNHQAARLSELNMKRIMSNPKNGGDRRSWRPSLTLDCHRKKYNGHMYRGHTDVYGRMWWDRPAPALTCRFDSLSNGRYGHPSQNRAISLREGSRLQSFKDKYIFYGTSKSEITTQIGNAVPVKLAEAVGRHILNLRRNISVAKQPNEI